MYPVTSARVATLVVLCVVVVTWACDRSSAPVGGDDSAFLSLAELETALHAAVSSGGVDEFWERVAAGGRMPIIFGSTAVFLYRGEAETVEWRGDFNGWEPSPESYGERLGNTDLWRMTRHFLPGTRLDYKIVVNGEAWLLDPLNPYQQVGGYGPNSEVRMPGWVAPETAVRRPDVDRGQFTDDLEFESQRLGYAVKYRVYTPPGHEENTSGLPVLYVTDGSDYWHDEMGSMVIVLDNLYAAGAIKPILVVFIDPWDREAGVNRREKELIPAAPGESAYGEFLVHELIPFIDTKYETSGEAEQRGLLGTSLGGLFATYMALNHPGSYGRIVVQSPACYPSPWIFEQLTEARSLSQKVFLSMGQYERLSLYDAHRLRDGFEAAGAEVRYAEPPDGHSWGQWRALLDDALLFLYGV